ncbi:MAG: hypothetical protein ACRCZ0_08350 [Cetobacterium sp.]
MHTLDNFQMFEVKEKVGMLQPDVWTVYSQYEKTGVGVIYKVMHSAQTDVRPTGIVNHSSLEEAFNGGKIVVMGLKKFKKKDLEKGKK